LSIGLPEIEAKAKVKVKVKVEVEGGFFLTSASTLTFLMEEERKRWKSYP
jgi:hypothetical protein